MRKDKISEIYQKEVDELLDNRSDFNLMETLSNEELDEIWEEISTETDIEEVWKNISSDLDALIPADSGSGILIKSIAAVLVILLGVIPVSKTSLISGADEAHNLTEASQDEQPEMHKTENNTFYFQEKGGIKGNISTEARSSYNEIELANSDIIEKVGESRPVQIAPIQVSNDIDFNVLAVRGKDDTNLFIYTEEIPFEKFHSSTALLYENLEEIRLSSKTYLNSLKLKDRATNYGLSLPPDGGARFSAGFTTLIRNTWLLNHETYNGLKSESLNTTEIVFFPDVALSLNYSLNRTWSFQADGFLCSNTGQDYFDYIYGQYSRKSITLSYSTIALSVKYRMTSGRILANRSSVNFLAGAYMSFLHQAHQKINTELENIRPHYLNQDLGVRAGGEFEFYLTDRVSLAPGLFISLGIPNIYRGDSYIPGFLRRTHNGSVAFQFAFYYHYY